jgi:hypothetical protein
VDGNDALVTKYFETLRAKGFQKFFNILPRFKENKMAKNFDLQKKLHKALALDSDSTVYDGCVREAGKKLYIDGIVYEIANGYWGYDAIYDAIDRIFTQWAEALGGEYYEKETASVLVVAF